MVPTATSRSPLFAVAGGHDPACHIVAQEDDAADHAARTLQRRLGSITGCQVPVLRPQHAPSEHSRITLGEPTSDSFVRSRLSAAGIEMDGRGRIAALTRLPNQDQGFAMQFGDGEVVLAGNTPQGTLHAVQTFCDRVFRDARDVFGVEGQDELTAPSFRYRSLTGNLGGPDWIASGEFVRTFSRPDGTTDVQAFVDWLAGYRINNMALFTFDLMWGLPYRSDQYPEAVNPHHPNVRHEFFGELLAQAARNYIDVWLMVDFPDCWLGVLKSHPELAAQGFEDTRVPPQAEEWWTRFFTGMRYQEVRPWREHSAVCASKPQVMAFWQGYWREVLERYPGIAGIGGQWCEHVEYRCPCSRCSRDFHGLQWRYFQAMVEMAEEVRPGLDYWMWYAKGGSEIARRRSELPNLTYVYWGDGATRPPVAHAQETEVDWYLSHGMTNPEYEPWLQRHALASRALGLEGLQKRMGLFHPCDQAYYAFAEFAWSPDTTWPELARRYGLRTWRVRDGQRVAEYSRDLERRAALLAHSPGDLAAHDRGQFRV